MAQVGIAGYPAPQNVAMVPFIPYVSDGFTGVHPTIQTITMDSIRIIYRASFHKAECCCAADPARKYLYVLENSYERNVPVGAMLCIWCLPIPANCCCTGRDNIEKEYFDRGLYDMQSCWWKIKFLNGAPSTFAGEVKLRFCCMDCPDCWNNWQACYFPSILGERVRVIPFQNYCWCCPTTACWIHNSCNCCGVKTGQPLLLYPFAECLKGGTSDDLVKAMEASRGAWKQRSSYTKF